MVVVEKVGHTHVCDNRGSLTYIDRLRRGWRYMYVIPHDQLPLAKPAAKPHVQALHDSACQDRLKQCKDHMHQARHMQGKCCLSTVVYPARRQSITG